jgi:hypothetical protein
MKKYLLMAAAATADTRGIVIQNQTKVIRK